MTGFVDIVCQGDRALVGDSFLTVDAVRHRTTLVQLLSCALLSILVLELNLYPIVGFFCYYDPQDISPINIAITIASCANPSWWREWKRSVGVRTQELQAVVVDRPPHRGGAHKVVPQVLSYLFTGFHSQNMIYST